MGVGGWFVWKIVGGWFVWKISVGFMVMGFGGRVNRG